MDYIERHIDGDLSLSRVSASACVSPFHFHRMFRDATGETLSRFVRRIRLEKAITQIAANPKKSITEVALDSGFSSSAAFTRAFRAQYGTTPSLWRSACGPHGTRRPITSLPPTTPRRRSRGEATVSFICADRRHEKWRVKEKDGRSTDVVVRDMESMHVAYVRHTGPYKGDAALFERLFTRLCRWAAPRGLIQPPETKILAVYHDNPGITAADRLRVSACVTAPASLRSSGEVGTMEIPGGRYAVARFELGADEYAAAWNTVCGIWLPESGYEPDDRPFFEMYSSEGGLDCRKKTTVDICVPVRPL
jgi:AraC family transcriptional regulator